MVQSTKRRRPRKSLTSAEAWKKVESTAYGLGIAWHLGPKESKQVSEAFFLLNHPSESTIHQKKYLLFLHEVRQNCGLQGVRLCAAALGQSNVRDMNIGQRKALVCKLGEEKYRPLINNPSFPSFVGDTQVAGLLEETSLCSTLSEATTTPLRLSTSNGESNSPIASIRHLVNPDAGFLHIQDAKGTSRNCPHRGSLEVKEYTTPASNCQANPYFTTRVRFSQDDWQIGTDLTNTQEIFEHASLEGIAAVFKGIISGAIRIRTKSFPNSVKTYSKASVTTVFPPWGGPVDCLLSLDICESRVQALAMALFNATVKWAENSLHIGFERGTTLTTPNSEVTLKGVGDETIAAVFGFEIEQAIKESPIRLRELKEGRLMTECVSMIITEKGAIVNLSLGLVRGLEIQKKLYT
ncbi:hypothetical protein N7471_013502 [Penicillium samsonianum]|uniref:uncharacterized protein n=1 Tax=Penicillium samsonianum TaxID=1882272 RepID=UPI0025489777|nr:uncharacterized protein N7471_013502 [Penicillium samsonianum]KAJ6118882.1 hypothetical protein N7471_013502 [Penicillium samsonianum]